MESQSKKEALIWSCRIAGLEEQPGDLSDTYEGIKRKLARYIDHLIQADFPKLIALLYRIDISRDRISDALAHNSRNETAGEIVTDLIIQRQMEKIDTRKKYRTDNL